MPPLSRYSWSGKARLARPSTSQPHRTMLKRTLLALEREIAELETT